MKGSGEESREVQRAGEGHYCICMCAQAPQSPGSISCWAEKEFHQKLHARINLTRGMLQSKAGSELPGLVRQVLRCRWPRRELPTLTAPTLELPTLTAPSPTLELQEKNCHRGKGKGHLSTPAPTITGTGCCENVRHAFQSSCRGHTRRPIW